LSAYTPFGGRIEVRDIGPVAQGEGSTNRAVAGYVGATGACLSAWIRKGEKQTIKHFLGVIAAFAVSAIVPATQAFAADCRFLASWDENYPGDTHIAEPFIKNVEAASKGSMKLIMSGPETVPPFEQLQPVGSGAFQFLFTHGAYHFGTTPFLAALEALGGDLQ